MVFKVGKGGVRSGNTLRGLNSAATKRYGRHACLLGSTSLGRRDLTRLIHESSDEDQLISETLAKTDVLLSLNKQQRWRLPAMIGHMIKAGDFNKGAVVSLLEKHKLKRKANCVSLVSNNPRTSLIAPKNNKYFTYSLDSVADDQSRRERRRARAEELKRLKVSPIVKRANRKQKDGNVIHSFTADGVSPVKLPAPGAGFNSEKPEYRLEVIYPCPRSCSLTYNPKYTDVTVAEGKTGEMEVKSNVRTPKRSSTTHRKRFTSRDIERLHCEEIDDDVNEMWDDCNDGCDDNNNNNITTDPIDDTATFYQHSDLTSSIEFAMEALLAQAKKAKELCSIRKNSHQQKPKKRSKTVSLSEDDKSHIVFIESEGKEKSEIKTPLDSFVSESNAKDDVNNLEHFRVILSTSETAAEELRRNFGAQYTEASCQPRRFVLDVTDDVTNILTSSRASTKERDFSSYLVCVYDGFYDNGLAAYKVAFNSMVGVKMEGFCDIMPFTKTSIPNIMNALACHLLDMKEKNGLEFVERKNTEEVKSDSEFLNSRMKLKVNVFDPSNEISKMAISRVTEQHSNEEQTAGQAFQFSEEMEDDSFCDVCYVNVTSTRIDSVSGTKLTPCGHLLCDECWRCHFRTGISNGKIVMACGGYNCDTKVGPVTLMSILNVSEVALLLKRQTEEELDTMDNAIWCPKPECGRVIKIDSKSQDLCVDVNCACGNKLCFSCLGPAHWPASCDQAEEYTDRLPSLTPAKEYVEEEETKAPPPFMVNKKTKKTVVVKIEGRLCPRCNKFIEKNGGCNFMMCRCGFQMCWACMKPFHPRVCKAELSWVAKLNKTLIIKHATAKEPVTTDSENAPELPKIRKNKQKASLYQRALQQRMENDDSTERYNSSQISPLVTKIVIATQRDSQFKREVFKKFSENTQEIKEELLSRFNVRSHVKSFIETIVEMKKELHRVREYTYILLQGTPHSVAKQRILKLANDLNGFCSFVTSILDLQGNQDAESAFRRLMDLQRWAERALDALIKTTHGLRMEQ